MCGHCCVARDLQAHLSLIPRSQTLDKTRLNSRYTRSRDAYLEPVTSNPFISRVTNADLNYLYVFCRFLGWPNVLRKHARSFPQRHREDMDSTLRDVTCYRQSKCNELLLRQDWSNVLKYVAAVEIGIVRGISKREYYISLVKSQGGDPWFRANFYLRCRVIGISQGQIRRHNRVRKVGCDKQVHAEVMLERDRYGLALTENIVIDILPLVSGKQVADASRTRGEDAISIQLLS